MKKLHELKQERSSLAKQMRALNDIASKESRSFTKDESKNWDEMLARHDELNSQIEREEKLRSMDEECINHRSSDFSKRSSNTIYQDQNGNPVEVLGKEERFYTPSVVDSEQRDHVSPGAMMRAMMFGPRNQSEERALGGSDSAGGITVPTHTLRSLIDMMRNQTQAVSAGVQTVLLDTDKTKIAKIESDPVPGWRAINENVKESEPTFSGVELNAHSLAVMVRVPRELLEDSINLDTALGLCLAGAMAQEFDRAVFFGEGGAKTPLGISKTNGVLEHPLNGELTSYAPVLTALQMLEESNCLNHTAAVMAPRSKYAFGGLLDTTGQPIRKPEIISGLPFLSTNQFPINEGTGTNESRIMAGDFSKVLMGIRSNLRVEILRERYADQMQYAFIAHLRGDVAVANPKAICQITGIQPPTAA
ncbi:TPA: phage major capsid protein [Vibrio parahaemolyticus]